MREDADWPGPEPRYLNRQQAAAYLGVSTTTFDEEVAAGLWPQARRRGAKGRRLTWDRKLLDSFADRDSYGPDPHANPAAPAQPAPLSDDAVRQTAEAAALRGLLHAAPRNRPQHHHSKAA